MSSLSNHPRIEMVKRASLTENPNSARKHTDKHYHQIADSIRRFGFLVPLIIDDAGLIVTGHGRWVAAGLLDLDEILVIRARFLSEANRRAFALAENRLSDLSGWDQKKLNAELEFLFEADYDLDVTGFSVRRERQTRRAFIR